MENNIIKLWEKNKKLLEEYISTTPQEKYDNYAELVKLIVKYILNDEDEWNEEKITVIDDSDYQGTQIFLIPKSTYQPSSYEYLVTYVYYGSCSGCDTLQSIHYYDEDIPTREQVKDYMNLCLHIIQKMKYLYTYEECAND